MAVAYYAGTKSTGADISSGDISPSSSSSSTTSTKGTGGSSGDSGGGGTSTAVSQDISSSTPEDQILNPDAGSTTKDLTDQLDWDFDITGIDHVNTDEEEAILKQVTDAAQKQEEAQVDNSVQTESQNYIRQANDANEEYQTQRAQIASEAQQALDNQVLYNQARGDNGGIGQAQYNSIQNTAAQNTASVNKAQTELATQTQQQIADLRAQGEFQKADSLLTLTQNYLSQLMSLKQWAQETNVSIDEFNKQLEEWKYNYQLSLVDAELNIANATGAFSNGEATASAYSDRQTQLAKIGQSLIEAGISPTIEQLEAMGMSEEQAKKYLTKYFPNG